MALLQQTATDIYLFKSQDAGYLLDLHFACLRTPVQYLQHPLV